MIQRKMSDLLDLFQDPPAEFRPQPVWSLNSVLTRERLTEMLQQFKEQGMGGVFILPRWGLVTPFLSERWFDMWGHALRECRRLGMGCQIYDEFVCPSGSAGGHTCAEAPHAAARILCARIHRSPTGNAGAAVAAFVVDKNLRRPRPATPRDFKAASSRSPVVTLSLSTLPSRPGHGGFPAPDLTRHDATAAFLKVGYEPYASRFAGEFGKTIRYAFTDEPQLPRSGDGFVWSELLSREFWKDHGYRFEQRLQEFCFGGAAAPAVRYDYFHTLNRLFCHNFGKQIYDWCDARGLFFTGHYMEHHWPNPLDTPSTMALLRWMHAPGNDYLAFQVFPDHLPSNRVYRFNMRELSSVANQLGRDKIMVESSGAGGYGISFALFKRAEDLLLAHGVNVMNPHLSHVSLAGMRQYEWPQTITDHSSWFPWYRHHADHVARVAAVLSQGRERNRVLLLQPTTTLWMRYTHPAFNPGHKAVNAELEAIAERHYEAFFALTDQQVDFDLGDETLLAELGRPRGKKLVVGQAAYDLVVLSDAMANWTGDTLRLMTRYLQAGGMIAQLGAAAPTHVDGRPSRAPARLKDRYAGQWKSATNVRAFAASVREQVAPRVTAADGGPLPEGLAWRRVEMNGGDTAWFFCNPWNRTMEMTVRLAGAQLVDLDTACGQIRQKPARREGPMLVAPLTLHPRGHALWISRARPDNGLPAARLPWEGEAVVLGQPRVTPARPNQLLVDYCDLDTGDVSLRQVSTAQADEAAETEMCSTPFGITELITLGYAR